MQHHRTLPADQRLPAGPKLRPARLAEATQCAAAVGLPDLAELTLQSVGAHDLTAHEVAAWIERAERNYDLVLMLEPTKAIIHRRYYLDGAKALLAGGLHREAAWPWRAIHESRSALFHQRPTVVAEAIDAAEGLSARLQLSNDAQVRAKLPILTQIADRLEASLARLVEHQQAAWRTSQQRAVQRDGHFPPTAARA